MKTSVKALLASAMLGASSTAGAVVIVYDASNTVSVQAISSYQTYGDEMDGMSVTAVFDSGFSETLGWADTGLGAGGVSGTNWSLGVTGDTFNADWLFTNVSNFTLTRLILDGSTGRTLFDVATDDAGGTTPDTFQGVTFVDTPSVAITATYSDQVQVAANAPVGDIWQYLTVDFLDPASGLGARGNFSFRQDTDNDIPKVPAPAPGVLALLGIGLIGMGVARRFRA